MLSMKNTIIANGVYENFLEVKRSFYLSAEDHNNKEVYYSYFDKEVVDSCFKIYNATRQRKEE